MHAPAVAGAGQDHRDGQALTAGRGPCQVDSMREPEMTIPPIEYLTAANVRRLRDPRVMGLDAFIHPYTDDAGAASVAQALARLPEHWKATPVCVAFSRLFAIDQSETLRIGDVVEGRRVEARRDPAEVTGIEVLLSCGGARWWTYISRGEIDAFGETGALRRRIVECDDHDFPRDPRTHRHTPPDAVGSWRYECMNVMLDGSPRTATYRHSETGHRVTVSSDIGADFTADVMDALRRDGVELGSSAAFDRYFTQVDRRTDAPVWRLSGERVDATVAKDLRGIRHWCEQGPGIVHVRGIEPRPVATVGYDDPTGDDVAADWRRS